MSLEAQGTDCSLTDLNWEEKKVLKGESGRDFHARHQEERLSRQDWSCMYASIKRISHSDLYLGIND